MPNPNPTPALHNLDYIDEAHARGLPLVLVDHWITRRQRLHVLIDPTEPLQYADVHLGAVLTQARARGHTRVLAVTERSPAGTARWYIRLSPTPRKVTANG